MTNRYQARYAGSTDTIENFSLYDFHKMCEVYNKELTVFANTIIPYISDRYNETNILKEKIAIFERANLLSEMNKLVSGLALTRATQTNYDNAGTLLDSYEKYFATIKDNLVKIHYEMAFIAVLAFDKMINEMNSIKRNKNVVYANRSSIEKIEFFINKIKSEFGNVAIAFNGHIDYTDAAKITNIIHRGEKRINNIALASHINKMKDIKESARKINKSVSQQKRKKQTTKQLMDFALDNADLEIQNQNLQEQVNSMNVLLNKKNAQEKRNTRLLAEQEEQLKQLRAENERLKNKRIFSLFGLKK